MAKMGRPKLSNPINHVVTVKFSEEDYQLLLEYANSHNLTVSQLLRAGAFYQMKHNSGQDTFGKEDNGLQKGS